MALPLLAYGIGAAVAWLGYKQLTKPRFVGDLAKANPDVNRADQAVVPIERFLFTNPMAAQQIKPPPGTLTVSIAVLGADHDRLQGPIVAFGSIPVSPPLGSVVVNRSDVTQVIRNGKIAAAAQGGFHGEMCG